MFRIFCTVFGSLIQCCSWYVCNECLKWFDTSVWHIKTMSRVKEPCFYLKVKVAIEFKCSFIIYMQNIKLIWHKYLAPSNSLWLSSLNIGHGDVYYTYNTWGIQLLHAIQRHLWPNCISSCSLLICMKIAVR